MSREPVTPGWDAIAAACKRAYPEQQPTHLGTIIKYMLGGPDPIDGISIYAAEQPIPHWHYVTHGFSELYEKESEDPELSGYGFELTLRLARAHGEAEPPVFAASLLQNLARYVFSTGNVFGPGEHIDFNGPIEAGSDTDITAGCFVLDPDLGEIDTPNGRLQFAQIVGITGDELAAIKAWNTNGVLELLARAHPKWVTDTSRQSILHDRSIVAEVRAKSASEGSSTGMLYTRSLVAERRKPGWRVEVGALELRTILAVLPGRVPHGRELVVRGQDAVLVFRSTDAQPAPVDDADSLVVPLSEQACSALLATLEAKRGTYRIPQLPDLVIEVVPTEVRSSDGQVVKVVG